MGVGNCIDDRGCFGVWDFNFVFCCGKYSGVCFVCCLVFNVIGGFFDCGDIFCFGVESVECRRDYSICGICFLEKGWSGFRLDYVWISFDWCFDYCVDWCLVYYKCYWSGCGCCYIDCGSDVCFIFVFLFKRVLVICRDWYVDYLFDYIVVSCGCCCFIVVCYVWFFLFVFFVWMVCCRFGCSYDFFFFCWLGNDYVVC